MNALSLVDSLPERNLPHTHTMSPKLISIPPSTHLTLPTTLIYPSHHTLSPLPHTSTPSHTPDSFPHTSISPHSPHPSHHTPLSLPHIITLIGINYSQSFVQFLPVYMLWMTLKYCTKQKCHYQHTLTIHSTMIYWIWVISYVFRCSQCGASHQRELQYGCYYSPLGRGGEGRGASVHVSQHNRISC